MQLRTQPSALDFKKNQDTEEKKKNAAKNQQDFQSARINHYSNRKDADFVCLFILVGLKTIFFLFIQREKLYLVTFSWRTCKTLVIDGYSLLPSGNALLGE